MNFLLLVRIFTTTGSAIAASFFWIAYALPALLVGPFAATTIDMVDRRKVLMAANFLQGSAILLYSQVFDAKFFLLFGIVFVYSFLNQFYVPAEQASLPTFVPVRDLPQANSLFFITQQAALVTGFGLGGVILETIGFQRALYLCSFFLFCAFISVSFLPRTEVISAIPRSLEEGFMKFFTHLAEGYQFIKGHNTVLAPFLLFLGIQVGLTVLAINTPLVAKEVLGINLSSAGAILIAPGGIGAALGSMLVSRKLKIGWRKKRIIEYSLAILGTSLSFVIFITPQLPHVLKIVTTFAGVIFAGASFVGILLPTQTFLQLRTPKNLRGRVFGNLWFLVTIVTIVPIIFTGTIVELTGVRTLLAILILMIFTVLFVSKKYGQSFLTNEE